MPLNLAYSKTTAILPWFDRFGGWNGVGLVLAGCNRVGEGWNGGHSMEGDCGFVVFFEVILEKNKREGMLW